MGRRTVMGTLLTLAGLSAIGGCSKEKSSEKTAKAVPSKHNLPASGDPNPTGEDRCPMCAMRVADNPNWVGAIELNNGATYYTCSVRCTLATAMNTSTFLGVPEGDVKRVRVPHYLAKGKSLDANEAWYVIDSDVRGPMGLALLPAASEEEAKTLISRHKGRALQRKEVTMPVLKALKMASKGE